MSIKGMKDVYRPKKMGRIGLGIKVPRENGHGEVQMYKGEVVTDPRATDHFIVPEEVADLPEIGLAPKKLPIYFLEEKIEDVFPTALVMFAGNGSVRCMGDGERVTYRSHYEPQTRQSDTLIYNQVAQWEKIEAKGLTKVWAGAKAYGTIERVGNTVKCLHMDCPQHCGWGCRPTGWFRFSIKGIVRQGYWQMVVHLNPMREMLSQLRHGRRFIEQYCGRATLMHSDWLLTLTGPEKKWIDTKKGAMLLDVYTPELELDPVWMTRAMEGRVRLPKIDRLTTDDVYGAPEELAMDSEMLEELPYDPTPESEDDELEF